MTENTKLNVFLATVSAFVLVALGALVMLAHGPVTGSNVTVQAPSALGGKIHNTQESFDQGIAVGGTEVINSSGSYVGAFAGTTISGTTIAGTTLAGTTSLTVGSGTAITKHLKTTAVINADSLGNGAATTSAVALTGAVATGSVYVTRTGSWASASSTVNIFGVPTTDSVTLYFQNNSSTAVDLSNTTYIVDYWAH